ncbi:MAG TPA: hypothetical protein VGR32_12060 [Brevundimonas sp.]|jgi:hypothetical protein|uniref:hypothetical protein n=1 Tax=Brevundimonas sp. TaxID=1871086 RepID=UPI002DF23CAB|nr:hypothetical protein [Brevundimonas sp.]
MTSDAVSVESHPRLRPLVAVLAILIAALQAFALAATGSIAAAAALVATALHLAGFVSLLISRERPGQGGGRAFLAGMAMAGAGLLAAVAVARILSPQAITAGAAGALALVAASALALAGTSVPGLRRGVGSEDPEAAADPSVLLVAAVGLSGAAFLGSPALDGAAALIVALWLVWGGIDELRADRPR